MPSLAKSFTEGDEIFMIKYKGNILSTDYTKSYTIVSISDECQEESGNFTRYATLDNGYVQILYKYSLITFTHVGVSYFVEKKQSFNYKLLCCCCF